MVTLSTICDGMQYGWASPAIPKLKEPDSPVQIEEKDILWIEMLYMLGGIIGLPLTIYFVDRIGRKYSILLASCNALLAWVLIGTARSVPTLYLGRLLAGVSADVNFVTIPMYIGEIADKEIRGLLGSIPYFMAYTGTLIVYSLAPFVPIYVTSIVTCSIIVLQILSFSFMPESPHYLVRKGRIDDARNNLKRLRNTQEVESDLKDIETIIEKQTQENGRIIDLFSVPSNLKAVIIMTVLNAAQHLSSISVTLMNLHTILGGTEGLLDQNSASIIVTAIMLVSLSTSGMVVDRIGRKPLLIVSCIATALSLCALATYFYLRSQNIIANEYTWVPTVAVICYALSFKFGLGIIPIVLTAEIFPTNVKAYGMTLADAVYVVAASITIYIYNTMEYTIGLYAPFYLFSACTFLTTFFVIIYIPETAGKTFQEIQSLLMGHEQKNKENNSASDYNS